MRGYRQPRLLRPVLVLLMLALLAVPLMPSGYSETAAAVVGLGAVHTVASWLWLISPSTVGVLEHLTDQDLVGAGRCRIDNVRVIAGSGRIFVGTVTRADGRQQPHLWAERADGSRVDVVCPTCRPAAIRAVLTVRGYHVVGRQLLAEDWGTRFNTKYVEGALAADEILRR